MAKVAKFPTLFFSGSQVCKGWKGCEISDFIIFRILRLRGLQRLQDIRLDLFQEIKALSIVKVARYQTLSFSG